MKIIILAAGMGMRLEDVVPKPMIVLKGKNTILDYQIKHLLKYVSVHDILVVVGYKKELLMEKYPQLTYIYNDRYAQTNTAKSLVAALHKIDDDVIWLNGDVYFDPRLIQKLMKAKRSSVLVQTKSCGDEEIKYTVDKKGFIKEISKTVKGGLGEAIGINLMKKKDLPNFVKHLEKVGAKDYFEKGMENMIKANKVKIKPIDIKNLFCNEIDFPADLKLVKKHLKSHKK